MRKVNFTVDAETGRVFYEDTIRGMRAVARGSTYLLLDTDEPVGTEVLDRDMAIAEVAMDAARTFEAKKRAAVGLAAVIRYQREVGGIVLPDQSKVDTSRPSQSQVASTFSALNSGLVASADWKGSEGWVSVTLAEFAPVAGAVADHVQRCFSSERFVGGLVDAASTEDELAAIDLRSEFEAEYARRAG